MPVQVCPVFSLELAGQLLLVVAADWGSTSGRLQRFERATVAGAWQPVGAALPVALGRSGLAWAGAVAAPAGEPRKCEGDGKTPSGVFPVTALFGVAESELASAVKLPYLAATPDLKAIDDPGSAWYNQIVDQSAIAQPDWTSCEDMRRADHRYTIGAVLAHNSAPVVPGAGSCIFLHVWAAPGVPTAGCTAMSLADMSEIARWLDGAASPLLVQLPLAEYECRRVAWGLPAFP